jgi:uncharacterized protein (DUF779 family)
MLPQVNNTTSTAGVACALLQLKDSNQAAIFYHAAVTACTNSSVYCYAAAVQDSTTSILLPGRVSITLP